MQPWFQKGFGSSDFLFFDNSIFQEKERIHMKAKTMFFFSFLMVFLCAAIGFSLWPSAVAGAADSRTDQPLGGTEEVDEPLSMSTTDEYDGVVNPNLTESGLNTFVGDDAGYSINAYGMFNTFVGVQAGYGTTGGIANTFIGHYAGHGNNTGTYNTFVGINAGAFNTQGKNTFIGSEAGFSNTSGGENTFMGYWAGYTNLTTGQNTFVGYYAGKSNAGEKNSFFGRYAGFSNTSGHENTFVGTDAGYDNTTGHSNAFLGYAAGANNIDGNNNTFLGKNAGNTNTTEDNNTFVGSSAGENNSNRSNTFVGSSSGKNNTTGKENTFLGMNAGGGNTTGEKNTFLGCSAGGPTDAGFNIGDDNTFVGHGSGIDNTSGAKNTFVGKGAGKVNQTGSYNVFIGYMSGGNLTGSNKLYIDSSDVYTKPLIYGDFSKRSIVVYGGFRSIASHMSSDQRLKRDVEPLKSSLDKISNLQGVSYHWKADEHPHMGLTEEKQIGLLAQNVEKELPELVSEDEDGYKAVSYSKLTAVLVEAVKELKTRNEKQQAEIEKLQALIKDLKS